MAKNSGGLKSFFDALSGRQTTASPGKIAEQNRDTGEKIVAALKTVDFSLLRNEEGMTDEKLDEMRTSVKALIVKLQNSPTIFDDISALDNILLNAADTLKTAAEYGYVDQAEWCINAISTGLLLLRDNVPPQRQADREQIIEKRVHYMENYSSLIVLYGKIDETRKSMSQANETIRQLEAEYTPKKQRFKELTSTVEGNASIARIKANTNTPDKLSKEDQELAIFIKQTGDLAKLLNRLRSRQYARRIDYESQLSMAKGYRTALDERPPLYDQDIIAEFKDVMDEIVSGMNRMLTEADAVQDIEADFDRKMEGVLRGEASTNTMAHISETIDKLIMPEDNISRRDLQEAELLKSKMDRARQKELENQQILTQIVNALQENTSENEDINFAENVPANSNEETDALSEENYNLNS